MDFNETPRVRELSDTIWRVVDERIRPGEEDHWRSISAEIPQRISPVIEEFKAEATRRRLSNLFLPNKRTRSEPHQPRVPRALRDAGLECDCARGHELLDVGHAEYGGARSLRDPRVARGLVESEVANSDPTQLATRTDCVGNDYDINGHKWLTSGSASPNAKVTLLIGMTDPEARRRAQPSLLGMPLDAPGVAIVRCIDV